MNFEWDDEKNKINKLKHGISFETATKVFDDKDRIEMYDFLHSTLEEDRNITIGKVDEVLFVVFTERGDNTRIISARKATPGEKEAYYGNR